LRRGFLSGEKHAPLWLKRVLDKLHAECCTRLTLDDLSATAGVHPVHLSRVFRRFQREGIGEYTAASASAFLPLSARPGIAARRNQPAHRLRRPSHFTREFRPRHRPDAARLPFATSTLC